jgi:hypothetical protein
MTSGAGFRLIFVTGSVATPASNNSGAVAVWAWELTASSGRAVATSSDRKIAVEVANFIVIRKSSGYPADSVGKLAIWAGICRRKGLEIECVVHWMNRSFDNITEVIDCKDLICSITYSLDNAHRIVDCRDGGAVVAVRNRDIIDCVAPMVVAALNGENIARKSRILGLDV